MALKLTIFAKLKLNEAGNFSFESGTPPKTFLAKKISQICSRISPLSIATLFFIEKKREFHRGGNCEYLKVECSSIDIK